MPHRNYLKEKENEESSHNIVFIQNKQYEIISVVYR